jgi:anti-sigma factor RsiW
MNTNEKMLGKTSDRVLDEAEKLIWAYLDELIEDDDAKRLEKLLNDSDQIRERYLKCAQIHADLYEHLRSAAPAESPVLGSLGNVSTAKSDSSSVTD